MRNEVAKDETRKVGKSLLSLGRPQKRSGINAEEWTLLETAAQSWGFDKESRRMNRTSSSAMQGYIRSRRRATKASERSN